KVQTVHVKTVHASLAQRAMQRIRIALSPRLMSYLWIEKRRLCTPGHHSVFVSQLLLDETRRVLPGLFSATLIAPGVDLPTHLPTPQDRVAARAALGLTQDKLVIGFIGHDFKKKGLDALLKAVALLPMQVQILVVGKPAQAPDYASLVQALGPGQECRFQGVLQDMHLAYAAMDCLAHPTTQDVFPMVLLEAMAHGLAVVTTAAPYNSMADLLTDGSNVALVPDPHDHRALSSALQRVLTDADLAGRLGAGGRQFAQRYSWLEIKAQYYQVYRQAMGQGA
ncbi:MAG: glycosyltransferase family 4 protein, partial [Rhodoferax sp.]